MPPLLRSALLGLLCLIVCTAATPRKGPHLTSRRVFELLGPLENKPVDRRYRVEILGLGKCELPAIKPEGTIKVIKELRAPTEFDPPQGAQNGAPILTPITPAAFETFEKGWTVRLSAKRFGKLIALYGAAEYLEAKMLPAGYGPITGPIYTEDGHVLTPNKLEEPRVQITNTRFTIFAEPGKPNEVTFYKGEKAVKHLIVVTAD